MTLSSGARANVKSGKKRLREKRRIFLLHLSVSLTVIVVVRHVLLALIDTLQCSSIFVVLRLDLIVLCDWRYFLLRVAKKIHGWNPFGHWLGVVQIGFCDVLTLHFCWWLPPLILVAEWIVVIQPIWLRLRIEINLFRDLQSSVVRNHLHGVVQLVYLRVRLRSFLFIITILASAAASIAAPPAARLISIVSLIQRI